VKVLVVDGVGLVVAVTLVIDRVNVGVFVGIFRGVRLARTNNRGTWNCHLTFVDG
jgi:hypothetical protein